MTDKTSDLRTIPKCPSLSNWPPMQTALFRGRAVDGIAPNLLWSKLITKLVYWCKSRRAFSKLTASPGTAPVLDVVSSIAFFASSCVKYIGSVCGSVCQSPVVRSRNSQRRVKGSLVRITYFELFDSAFIFVFWFVYCPEHQRKISPRDRDAHHIAPLADALVGLG